MRADSTAERSTFRFDVRPCAAFRVAATCHAGAPDQFAVGDHTPRRHDKPVDRIGGEHHHVESSAAEKWAASTPPPTSEVDLRCRCGAGR
ncbi:MAG: hypothetical protein M5R42_12855 [Rhodocyclaceae bacterium]|nr:hypothetical protein [Rhodocyclaceae bacterium]